MSVSTVVSYVKRTYGPSAASVSDAANPASSTAASRWDTGRASIPGRKERMGGINMPCDPGAWAEKP